MTWAPIPRFPGYEVSQDGQVRSIDRIVAHSGPNGRRCLRGRIIKPQKSKLGYILYRLSVGGKCATVCGHQLVAEVFISRPASQERLCIDHINGNGLDNRIENLRWTTWSVNISRTRKKRGKRVHRGVQFDARYGSWYASIHAGGKMRYLGSFKTSDDAVVARRAAELLYLGEVIGS